jgi:hypothetical protein
MPTSLLRGRRVAVLVGLADSTTHGVDGRGRRLDERADEDKDDGGDGGAMQE